MRTKTFMPRSSRGVQVLRGANEPERHRDLEAKLHDEDEGDQDDVCDDREKRREAIIAIEADKLARVGALVLRTQPDDGVGSTGVPLDGVGVSGAVSGHGSLCPDSPGAMIPSLRTADQSLSCSSGWSGYASRTAWRTRTERNGPGLFVRYASCPKVIGKPLACRSHA